jgi:hypothetical protein
MAVDDTHPAGDSDVLQEDSLVAVDFDAETGSWAMLPSGGFVLSPVSFNELYAFGRGPLMGPGAFGFPTFHRAMDV